MSSDLSSLENFCPPRKTISKTIITFFLLGEKETEPRLDCWTEMLQKNAGGRTFNA